MAWPVIAGMIGSLAGGAASSYAGQQATQEAAQAQLNQTRSQIAFQKWLSDQEQARIKPFMEQGYSALPEMEQRRLGTFDIMASPYASQRQNALNTGMAQQMALRGAGSFDKNAYDDIQRNRYALESQAKTYDDEMRGLSGVQSQYDTMKAQYDKEMAPYLAQRSGPFIADPKYIAAKKSAFESASAPLIEQIARAKELQAQRSGLSTQLSDLSARQLGMVNPATGAAAYGMRNALQGLRASEEGLGYERALDRVRIGQGNAAQAGQQYGQYANALSGAYQQAGNINSALTQSLANQRQQLYGDVMNTAAGVPASMYLYNQRKSYNNRPQVGWGAPNAAQGPINADDWSF